MCNRMYVARKIVCQVDGAFISTSYIVTSSIQGQTGLNETELKRNWLGETA